MVMMNKHWTHIRVRLTFSVNADTDARRRRRQFNVREVLALNNQRAWMSGCISPLTAFSTCSWMEASSDSRAKSPLCGALPHIIGSMISTAVSRLSAPHSLASPQVFSTRSLSILA
jgi:hypothetical protein